MNINRPGIWAAVIIGIAVIFYLAYGLYMAFGPRM